MFVLFSVCSFSSRAASSSADAVDPAPAGRRAAELQRDAGMLHRGAPHVAALLDAGQRADVARQRQVQGGVHTGRAVVQGADEADHRERDAHRLRRVQVRGEKLAWRDRRHDPSVQ